MQFSNYLILDDDPLSALLNELMVYHSGDRLESTIFHDPIACLRYIRTTPMPGNAYTCLLLDIEMPKLNGWKFLTELEQLPINVRHRFFVVMVTSSKDPDDLERLQNHPFVCGYLQKPVSTERFKALLDHLAYRISA